MKLHHYPIIIGLLFASALSAAEVVYVHSAKAKLLETPAFSSNELAMLLKGTELEFIESQKRWMKVSFEGQEGWVSILMVKPEPPIEKLSVIGSEAVTLEGDARKRASAVATAGATRGLTDGGDGTSELFSDYEELLQMEATTISASAINDFASAVE